MTDRAHCADQAHSNLLEQHFAALLQSTALGPVLDLACGGGRNGLYLDRKGLAVVFADRNDEQLTQLKANAGSQARFWPVDLEQPGLQPLANQRFGAILVFRYLHRPLFDAIKQAVAPGGMIIYETFTHQQAEIGRPKNPDFLLKPGELEQTFADWQILDTFEGIQNANAVASIVAVKPL